MTSLETAQAEATKQHPDVEVRDAGGLLVYSYKGVDMLSRKPGSMAYTVMAHFPKYQLTPGDVQHVSDPIDEQCACTARDLAKLL